MAYVASTPCDCMLPGHRHCKHGHVGDCTDLDNCEVVQDVEREVELKCGCTIVYYTDNTACHEHNHVECDG